MQTLDTGLPPGIDLSENYIVQFTALNPSTGAVVSGVNVSKASLLVENRVGGNLDEGFGDIEPLFTPIPATEA